MAFNPLDLFSGGGAMSTAPSTKKGDYSALVNKYAQRYNVSPELVKRVIKVESGGNPTAASGTGPVGLMQVSRALAKQYGYKPEDRLDPEKNIEMGTRYLRENLNAFGGNIQKALLGYNQGTGGAKQMLAGKIPMAQEGAAYMANKNFRDVIGSDKFDPSLINRARAKGAKSMYDVAAENAVPQLGEPGVFNPAELGNEFAAQQAQPQVDPKSLPTSDKLALMGRMLQSIGPGDQRPTPQAQIIGSHAGGFNFNAKAFENPLLQRSYQQLYYSPNFSV